MDREVIKRISKLEQDIKSIKVQGATNVAIATLKGIELFAKKYAEKGKVSVFKKDIIRVGNKLAYARDNEPLACNVIKFIQYKLSKYNERSGLSSCRIELIAACRQYLGMIASAKIEIIKYGTEALVSHDVILTHCHSSTAVTVLKNLAKFRSIKGEELQVVATETRPLYQGRKTGKELFEAGLNVTQIVDSACASFIVKNKYLPVSAVIVGCDEFFKDGSFVNKVGTYSIALAAKEGGDEFYVATTLLKLSLSKKISSLKIEQRESSEVWKGAPKGLAIINPAFEHIPSEYVTGYITEAGLLRATELSGEACGLYKWLFE